MVPDNSTTEQGIALRFLGDPSLRGASHVEPSGMAGVVLALIALAGRPVSHRQLVDWLWGEAPPPTADSALRTHLTKVRSWFREAGADDGIERRAGAFCLAAGIRVDLVEFGVQAKAAAQHRDGAEAAAALASWSGVPFDTLPYNEMLAAHRSRLLSLHAAAAAVWAESVPVSDAARQATTVFELYGMHPESDRLAPCAIRLLAASGDRRRALDIAVACRTRAVDAGLALTDVVAAAERDALLATGPSAVGAPLGVIGRTREERLLIAALSAATTTPQWVVITGEAGIGKSTLCAWLAEQARRSGVGVHVSSCFDGPIVEPFDSIARALDAFGAGKSLIIEQPGLLDGDQAALYRSVETALDEVTRHDPGVIVIDDFQWSDPSSASLVGYLAQRRPGRLMMVLSCRTPDLRDNSATDAMIGDLLRRTDVVHLPLDGLNELASGRLLESLIGRRPSPADRRSFHGQTGGNPLYLTQLGRVIGVVAGAGSFTEAAGELPQTLASVLRRRADRLGPTAQRVAVAVALTHSGASADLLSELLQIEPDAFAAAIAEAIAEGVIVERTDSLHRLDVAHALFRPAFTQMLDPVSRMDLHTRFAAALEQRRAIDGDVLLGELAYHLSASGAEGGLTRRCHTWSRRP